MQHKVVPLRNGIEYIPKADLESADALSLSRWSQVMSTEAPPFWLFDDAKRRAVKRKIYLLLFSFFRLQDQ